MIILMGRVLKRKTLNKERFEKQMSTIKFEECEVYRKCMENFEQGEIQVFLFLSFFFWKRVFLFLSLEKGKPP